MKRDDDLKELQAALDARWEADASVDLEHWVNSNEPNADVARELIVIDEALLELREAEAAEQARPDALEPSFVNTLMARLDTTEFDDDLDVLAEPDFAEWDFAEWAVDAAGENASQNKNTRNNVVPFPGSRPAEEATTKTKQKETKQRGTSQGRWFAWTAGIFAAAAAVLIAFRVLPMMDQQEPMSDMALSAPESAEVAQDIEESQSEAAWAAEEVNSINVPGHRSGHGAEFVQDRIELLEERSAEFRDNAAPPEPAGVVNLQNQADRGNDFNGSTGSNRGARRRSTGSVATRSRPSTVTSADEEVVAAQREGRSAGALSSAQGAEERSRRTLNMSANRTQALSEDQREEMADSITAPSAEPEATAQLAGIPQTTAMQRARRCVNQETHVVTEAQNGAIVRVVPAEGEEISTRVHRCLNEAFAGAPQRFSRENRRLIPR